MKRFGYMLISVLFTLFFYFGNGQIAPKVGDFAKIVEVLPPSPNAASLGKYGGLDLSLASGMANVSVPLFDFSSINLKLPLSISYTSTGFRIDEIPGRVATGWSLNAGGVITRTVNGAVDEMSQRVIPPADFPARSRALIDFMESINSSDVSGPYDGQPDLFSFNFNGYTGRFLLDSNLNPIVLNHSNLKIEQNLKSTGWNFKITTSDGVQYFFGGDSARERTKKVQVGAACGKSYGAFISTAWYLKKVIDSNNDEMNFHYSSIGSNYRTSISQSIYSRNTLQYPASCAGYTVTEPTLDNTFCENSLQTTGVLLEAITSTGGAMVKFLYINRNDYNDKLLSRLEIYHREQPNAWKVFSFNYQYSSSIRPFLINLKELAGNEQLFRIYSFTYNDFQSLPPRLSFSQDHFGFYNGKENNTFIPLPSDLRNRKIFPLATANRDVDPFYCQKGLLSSITYPTGGKDSILYEGNTIYKQVEIYPPSSTISANSTNTSVGGIGTTGYSSTIAINFNQQTRLIGRCSSNSTTAVDPIRDKAIIDFLRTDINTIVYSITVTPGVTFDEILDLNQGGSYKIKVTTYGNNVTASATLSYIAGNITYQNMNVNTGGVRVSKVISYDGITTTQNIKKYFYHKLNNPVISSAAAIYNTPIYEKYLRTYVPCMSGASTDPSNPTSFINCDVSQFDFYSMYSNTLNNIYLFPSSPISYGTVIESFGGEYENGGIEHQFTVYEDQGAYSLLGDGILLGSPLSSYSWKNSREIYQNIFKRQGLNNIPVKKIFTNYKEDVRIDSDIKAYVVNKKYTPYCSTTPPSDVEMNAYDLLAYSFFRKWVYIDTVRTWTYDKNGQNYLEQFNISEYGNAVHALPTKQISYTSNNTIEAVVNKYPMDIGLIGNEETARQALIAKNIINPILQTQISKGLIETLKLKTAYNVFSNGLVLPISYSVQKAGSSLEERRRITKYNNYGKILEQSKSNDITLSYIWSDTSNYPIAEVTNAPSTDISFTSFEWDDKGNWSFQGSVVSDNLSFTGKKHYTLSTGPISKSSLNINTTYVCSFWAKTDANVLVNGTPGIMKKGPINGWYYWQKSLTGVSSITINGSGAIDELRLYPSSSQMTTFTYEPLTGISSQTDANNVTTYYEYDNFHRLKNIKDFAGNIVKNFRYNYAKSCGDNCTVLSMQTFNGNAAIGYPVGVFNINGQLLGNANNKSEYASIWNNNSVNRVIGTLTATSDSLQFNLQLNTGQEAPTGITGCRYYQYDLSYTKIDGIRNTNAAYVDFGDGTSMRLGNTDQDTSALVLAANTTMEFFPDDKIPYFVHTYPNENLKTITLYHNDGGSRVILDNRFNPATSLTKIRNARGIYPQFMTGLGSSSFQDSTSLTISNISNWNSISSITNFILNAGDGFNGNMNVRFTPDFMQNNRGLTQIFMTWGGPYNNGCTDSTFKLSRLKSNWNTYFTKLDYLQINDNHWNREDLSSLIKLRHIVIGARSQNYSNDPVNNPIVDLPTSVIDTVINQIAAGAGKQVSNGYLAVSWLTPRSSASDSSVNFLKSKGWQVWVGQVLQ